MIATTELSLKKKKNGSESEANAETASQKISYRSYSSIEDGQEIDSSNMNCTAQNNTFTVLNTAMIQI